MHHVKIIRCATAEEVGKRAADMYAALLQEKPACLLGLATGSTPPASLPRAGAPLRSRRAGFLPRSFRQPG